MSRPKYDLIKTIDDDEEVTDFSEPSDDEENFQPTKQKVKRKADFSTDFQFVSSVKEYNADAWDDLTKYINRKAKNKVDDKIDAHRKERLKKNKELKEQKREKNGTSHESEESEDDFSENNDTGSDNNDIVLSDDELKKDDIKVKDRSVKRAELLRRKGKGTGVLKVEAEEPDPEDDFFEDAPPFDESTTFNQMNLSRPLLKAIAAMNFVHPTPIQAATIPMALQGRDICGCAATGTGKTAAYMLPVLERLLYRPNQGATTTRVLVLVPTRELGVQVYQVTKQLAQFTSVEVGLSVGGLDVKTQEIVLRKNPDIVIATPGRLIDHIRNTPSFSLDSIEVLILDEADRMLDENFSEQMKEIVKQTARTRQTMLFSATMTDQVEDLASVSLSKPVRIFVDNNSQVAFNLRQEFIRIRDGHEGDREAILAALVCRTFRDHAMVFVTTKRQAHRVRLLLGLLGVKVGELHGDLTQPQRLEALRRFKDEELDVLVATDVAARGLDIRGVKSVINFTMPAALEHYIHRVGRTARAGRSGISVSLAGEKERRIVREVIKNATNPVKSRVIPPEIISKYREKCEVLKEDIKNILEEEFQERQLNKLENQANRAEKMLKGEQLEKRDWFQSRKEREEEKERLRLSEKPNKEKAKSSKEEKKNLKDVKVKDKKKNKKRHINDDTPEGRVAKEMEKVALLQARLAKRKTKQKRMNTVYDKASTPSGNAASRKRKISSFSTDLTDTSIKGVKRIRYEANAKKKMDEIQKRKSSGVNKNTKSFNKKMTKLKKSEKPGKNFGAKKKR
ncbi:putative ATP-dependent RNA helicase [Frankliniella fusca]|uniref:RNA helicase n=1 Tax=Frankliniella fusca TaxID=407009 RepID=A0AAE1LKX4_9NEOP|nr:putative ATP-dependent RNA helicase [Frankliniella fusca]